MTGDGACLTYDAGRMQILLDGTPLHVTPTERAILAALINAHGDVVSWDGLAEAVRGGPLQPFEGTGWLLTHLRNIRHRLGPHRGLLVNVRTYGYRLDTDVGEGHGTVVDR